MPCPLLYVRPHPTAARRAATLASSECEMHMGARISLRPLQRRFKARKKPEGYTSTPTGLKRLKTQITAFRGNKNGKGTPSGVPQPIHKRKLVLVEEEFDASSFGGAEGNRTPVRKQLERTFFGRSLLFTFPYRGVNKHTRRFGRVMMHGRGNSYPPHVRHSDHTQARFVALPGRMGA